MIYSETPYQILNPTDQSETSDITNVLQAHFFLIWQIRNNDCTFKFEFEEYLWRIDSNEILKNSRVSLDIDREKITLILRRLRYGKECGIEILKIRR
jgi:hypothetical protein